MTTQVFDINSLSFEQLLELQAKAAEKINAAQKAKADQVSAWKAKVTATLEALDEFKNLKAEGIGFRVLFEGKDTLVQFSDVTKVSIVGQPVAVKYRLMDGDKVKVIDGKNCEWTGRGVAPKWVAEYLINKAKENAEYKKIKTAKEREDWIDNNKKELLKAITV